jgi:predicted DCC family thiol-disulfide oxidoreductase YuxK
MLKPLPQLTVWYNTRCPVCNAGINRQRGRLIRVARAGAITFRDIGQQPDALLGFGADVEDVRRRLHAVDSDGHLYIGIDCVIEIWRRTPSDAWLAGVAGLAWPRRIARFGYDRFADLLYAWNRWRRHW